MSNNEAKNFSYSQYPFPLSPFPEFEGGKAEDDLPAFKPYHSFFTP